ncbi:squalene/phytoene synthase family protein [Sagittula sp. M10.9X]|uniref:Squalene/phytoene synthase family protein n=1 Tax=Sagittula salina TaxID=2820268 RepID=A0A940MGE9_9RHOB|nr:squalene/phytoene synthase family protein [Sagittula salina]
MEEGSDLFACAQIVERGDPERFRTAMAGPVGARAVLFPLYAFNVEVARAPWVTAEPMIAEMRLQWWRDALDEIRRGGPVRRHEVVTPLAEALDAEACTTLDALIEARRADIERAPFDTADALWSYLAATGGGLMQVAARALGDGDGRCARYLGTATGLAAWLMAVPELEARAKLPLPDGRPEAVQTLALRGLETLAEARKLRGSVPRAARVALLPGAHAGMVLNRAMTVPERVKQGALRPSEAAQRFARLRAAVTGRF